MKKVLKFFLGFIVFSFALFCAVILISLEQCSIALKKKAEKDKAPKEVITRVEEYVRNKYDVKAKVVDSEANYEWEGSDFSISHKKYDGSCRNQVDIIGDYFIYRIYTEEWYKENKYYKDGDKKIFGVYVDKYYY